MENKTKYMSLIHFKKNNSKQITITNKTYGSPYNKGIQELLYR